MKTFLVVLTIFLFMPLMARAEFVDYTNIYNSLTPINIRYDFDEDPYEIEDNQKYFISPYPLVRLSSPLKFKNIKLPEGYYLLKPMEDQGKTFVMFKQKGKIVALIPVFAKEKINILTDYPKVPEPKKPWYKKMFPHVSEAIDNRMNGPKVPKGFVKSYDIDQNFFQMDLYFKAHAYKMIFMFDNQSSFGK